MFIRNKIGVKRYVSGQGKQKAYNPEYQAIIDDNTFARHIWCFLENGKTYNGPSWYGELKWNETPLPDHWVENINKLLTYRTQRIMGLLNK